MVSISNASASSDSTWEGTFIALWKVLEVTFGVKCGCLPAVKPLIEKILPKSDTESDRSKDTEYKDHSLNRLDSGITHSSTINDRDIGLQDRGHASPLNGGIGTTFGTVNQPRRDTDSESEEWMFTDDNVSVGPTVKQKGWRQRERK